MIFRRKMEVPEARGSKRLRLVKVALLAFLMTPKVALLAFVMAPIVYFYQKPPLMGPEIPKTESIEAAGRCDTDDLATRRPMPDGTAVVPEGVPLPTAMCSKPSAVPKRG
jgi:hypothetical protein